MAQRGTARGIAGAGGAAARFGLVCPLSAVERMVTDAPPASTADLQPLGLAVDYA